MVQLAQLAAVYQFLHLPQRRDVAVVVAETELDAGGFGSRYGALAIGFFQRERFFGEGVLTGRRRGDDLIGV